VFRCQLVDGPDGWQIAVLTPPGPSAVVMRELHHEKVLADGAVPSKMVPLKHDILCNTTGPVVDDGQRRVED
jgi:hypothetical protein